MVSSDLSVLTLLLLCLYSTHCPLMRYHPRVLHVSQKERQLPPSTHCSIMITKGFSDICVVWFPKI